MHNLKVLEIIVLWSSGDKVVLWERSC